jgi:hypothetical protein
MKLQVLMTEKPVRGRGTGLYEFEFHIDGEKIGGAACNPMWQDPISEQVAECFSAALESQGFDLQDNEIFASAFWALEEIEDRTGA